MTNPNKAKGSQWERDVVAYLQANGFPYAERKFGAGPLTEKEMQAWDNGDDPCSHHVRLGTPKDWDEYL